MVTFPDTYDECTPNTFTKLMLEQANMILGCNLSEWPVDRIGLINKVWEEPVYGHDGWGPTASDWTKNPSTRRGQKGHTAWN